MYQIAVPSRLRATLAPFASRLLDTALYSTLIIALINAFAYESVGRTQIFNRYSYNYLFALVVFTLSAVGVIYVFAFNASLRDTVTRFTQRWHIPLLILTGIAGLGVAVANVETRLQIFACVLTVTVWLLASEITTATRLTQIFRSVPLLMVWIALVNAFLYQSVGRTEVVGTYSVSYFLALVGMTIGTLLLTRLYTDPPEWALASRGWVQRYIWHMAVVFVPVLLEVMGIDNIQVRIPLFAVVFSFVLWFWYFREVVHFAYSPGRDTPLNWMRLATTYMAVDIGLIAIRSGFTSVQFAWLIALCTGIVLNTVVAYVVERQPKFLQWLAQQMVPIWQPTCALILALAALLCWQPQPLSVTIYVLIAAPGILTLILNAAPDIDERRAIRFIGMTAVVVGLVALGAQVYLLTYIPGGHYHDEGAYSHIAMLGMQTGRLGGDLYGFPPRNYIGFGNWLYTLGAWYEVFGFGWLSGRLYSLVFGLGALAVLGWTVWRFVDRRVALFAVSMLAMSWLFVEARSIRPDTITLFSISVSLFCFLYALEKSQLWRYALCGFVTALAFEAHLLIAAYWIAYGAVFGLQWLQTCLEERRWRFPTQAFAFGLASIVPVVFYFVSHFVPDMGLPSATVLSSRFDLWNGINREIGRWLNHLTYLPTQVESFIILLSIIALIMWGKKRRFYVLLLGLVMLGFVIVAPNDWRHYNRFFLPAFILIISAALSMMLESGVLARFSMYAAMVLSVSLVVFAGNIRDELLVRPDIARDMASGALIRPLHPVAQYIIDHVPPGDTVVAEMLYYLALDDPYRYVWFNSYINVLGDIREQMDGPNDRELLDTWRPAVIVLDQMVDPWHWGVRNPLIPAITDYAQDNDYLRVREFEPDFIFYLRPDLVTRP